MGVKVSEL